MKTKNYYQSSLKKGACLVVTLLSTSLLAFSQSSVGPLLTTSWNQSTPYNQYCPMTQAGGNVHSAAGCGAIAVAQILTKYKKPAHGYGHSYYQNTKTGIMTDVDYSQMTMEWSKVKDSYSASYSGTASEKAVASIVYQVGAAMQMSYYTSSAPKNMGQMMWGLHHYLHMNPDSRYRRRVYYSTPEWIEMLYRELQAGRPVYYRGQWNYDDQSVAHIFVIDGFRKSDGKYHANFGHGASNNKYVDLNVLNYTNQYDHPGGRSVCYNVEQSMITDFYPVDGLTDKDFSPHSFILSSNIHFANDLTAHSKTISLGSQLKLKMDIRDCSLTGGAVPFGLGIYRNGVLLQVLRDSNRPTISFNGGGLVGSRLNYTTLPSNLQNGRYELKLVSSPDDGASWEPVWDNAPNHMDMTVSNGQATVVLAPDFTRETYLYLRESIRKVENSFQSTAPGTAFRLALKNPSQNNFENDIRITIKVGSNQYNYDVRSAIYGGCDVDFDVLVPSSVVDLTGKTYTVKAYYYEQNQGSYIELTTTVVHPVVPGDVDGDGALSINDVTALVDYLISGNSSSIVVDAADCDADGVVTIADVTALIDALLNGTGLYVNGIKVYDHSGRLVIDLPSEKVQSRYGIELNSLPQGNYIVKEGYRTRELRL